MLTHRARAITNTADFMQSDYGSAGAILATVASISARSAARYLLSATISRLTSAGEPGDEAFPTKELWTTIRRRSTVANKSGGGATGAGSNPILDRIGVNRPSTSITWERSVVR